MDTYNPFLELLRSYRDSVLFCSLSPWLMIVSGKVCCHHLHRIINREYAYTHGHKEQENPESPPIHDDMLKNTEVPISI
eukprot:c26604_g1_i1 orf=1-234(-)